MFILIHNPPYTTIPFASPDDFEIFVRCCVEYGIVINDIGTFLVKNKEVKINKNKNNDIEKDIGKIKINMIRDFNKKYNREFKETDSDDLKDMNTMIKRIMINISMNMKLL